MRVKTTLACLAGAALAVILPASSAAGGSRADHTDAGESIRVLATGLHDPRGVDAREGRHGDRLLVAQSGTGEITEILARGKRAPIVRAFAALPAQASPSDVAARGFRTAFATAGAPPEGGGAPTAGLLRVPRGGQGSLVADIAAYQQGDPDPVDQENEPTESNPFGIALLRHGALVTDAAGNDLLKVVKDGSIETVARFPTREVPFPAGFPEGPPPGTLVDAESVPTGVAVGPDGAWYVAELLGFPFTKGASRIWRIEPGTEDHDCDATAKRGPCRVFAEGFTSVIDIAFAGDTLLVLELVKEGLLAAESGGAEPIGALWAVEGRSRTEIAAGSLRAPGGVAVADGAIYVTTGTVFGPGAGEVVRIDGALEGDDHESDDDSDARGDRKRHGDDDDDEDRGGRERDAKRRGDRDDD